MGVAVFLWVHGCGEDVTAACCSSCTLTPHHLCVSPPVSAAGNVAGLKLESVFVSLCFTEETFPLVPSHRLLIKNITNTFSAHVDVHESVIKMIIHAKVNKL